MYIVSRFHDYYDTAIGFGIDKSCVYKRETQDFRKREDIPTRLTGSRGLEYALIPVVLGFAGGLFPVIEVKGPNDVSTFLHSLGDIAKFYADTGCELRKRQFYWRPSRRLRHEISTLEGQAEFMKPETHHGLIEVFHARKCPVFASYTYGLVLNPRLQDFGFQKIKDPFTAFQEIAMFIGGVLGVNENQTVTLSDVDKRDKKGFNDWSFKTRPHKK